MMTQFANISIKENKSIRVLIRTGTSGENGELSTSLRFLSDLLFKTRIWRIQP